ncbi:hypothetical protein MLD38_021596 [Melastoma candidum]|uniref:Uncharacterized protein n=1 Tax=Melastoma candidum TaxID=119954 RepID=A0ACB9QJZ2_9MYRT|nr:hypothetical protein MLD38_021596 [Melastoma candidum]
METARRVTVGFLSASSIVAVLFFAVSGSTGRGPDESRARVGSSSSTKVWPDLEFGWRVVVATIVGFVGSACGTVGGVGGGGIFVSMLTLVVGFDTKSAAAISKCMIMAASMSSVWYNLTVRHPTKEIPILDYDLSLLFQPVLLVGITVGVSLSVIFPYWLITLLIIILFVGTSSRSFFKGLEMWKEETALKKEMARQEEAPINSRGELLIDTIYEPLVPREEISIMQVLSMNFRWKWLTVLFLVWASMLLLQVLKNYVTVCGAIYWLLFFLQFPVAFMVFGYQSVKLYRADKKRMMPICEGSNHNGEVTACEATIRWTPIHITLCAVSGLIGGCVGGLLGAGGGFILGPLLLEIGVIPQVAGATATFVMMFSSSLSVVEFYLLKRFPIPYALYLMAVSLVAGFLGQYLVRKIVTILGRVSIIVFILSGVIFVSAIAMGIVGIKKSIMMMEDHDFMGFYDFCTNQ